MAALVFDALEDRIVQAGVSNCVLFAGAPKKAVKGEGGAITEANFGVVWNGITTINDSPEGGEANTQYADNIEYIALRGPEKFNGSISAFTYPVELNPSMGIKEVNGVEVYQQNKDPFNFCYISQVANGVEGLDYGEKLHIVYNATCDPVEEEHATINDSPEGAELSWDFSTIALAITAKDANGKTLKPTAHLTITKTEANKAKYEALKAVLYGTDGEGENPGVDSYLLMPDEVIEMMK